MNQSLYLIMGISGCGKSTVGRILAQTLGVDFVEGDDYHSRENVERMAVGIPLTDLDRADWLSALANRIRLARDSGTGVVLTCSALKRSYRDILRSGAPDLQFIFLDGSRSVIAERLNERRGHFMPPSLLDSQLATLEKPSPDENAWTFDVSESAQEIVDDIVTRASK
jgi:carbohydrate kinase (thermoresistant glucokinase family)